MKMRSRRILNHTVMGAAAGGAVMGAAGYAASNESDNSYFPYTLFIGLAAGAIAGSVYSWWSSPQANMKKEGFEEKVIEPKKADLIAGSFFKPAKQIESIEFASDINDADYYQMIESVWERNQAPLV